MYTLELTDTYVLHDCDRRTQLTIYCTRTNPAISDKNRKRKILERNLKKQQQKNKKISSNKEIKNPKKKQQKNSLQLLCIVVVIAIIKYTRCYHGHHDGGIIVHVAASQLTSSKLCSTSNPMAENPSKLPSPSICTLVSSSPSPGEASTGDLHSREGRRCTPAL